MSKNNCLNEKCRKPLEDDEIKVGLCYFCDEKLRQLLINYKYKASKNDFMIFGLIAKVNKLSRFFKNNICPPQQ
tara:strand:+ start:502 stop:723 length:222 start_codon:yes stop_codon:yes gene_type:complete